MSFNHAHTFITVSSFSFPLEYFLFSDKKLRECLLVCFFTLSTQETYVVESTPIFLVKKLRFKEATLFFQLACHSRDSNCVPLTLKPIGCPPISRLSSSLPVLDNEAHNKFFKISVIYEHICIHSPNTFWTSDHYELSHVLIRESTRRDQ